MAQMTMNANPSAGVPTSYGTSTPILTPCNCPSTGSASTFEGDGKEKYVTVSGVDDSPPSNAETLLSSNAKFQAISAIAITQDGVINLADQGKNPRFISF